MRMTIPVVVDMTDEQVQGWAKEHGLGDGEKVYAREMVQDVRSYVLNHVQCSTLGEFSTITLKGS